VSIRRRSSRARAAGSGLSRTARAELGAPGSARAGARSADASRSSVQSAAASAGTASAVSRPIAPRERKRTPSFPGTIHEVVGDRCFVIDELIGSWLRSIGRSAVAAATSGNADVTIS
jgi:hypothetical protein